MGRKRGGSRRGQATIFVVLGIVMLMAVVFAIYARALILKDQHRRQAELLVSEYIVTANLNYYVTGCLDQVTEGVLMEFGAEGGILNSTSRPSIDYLAFTDAKGDQKVAYGLVPMPAVICPEVAPSPPAYPKEEMALDNLLPLYNQGMCRYLKDGGFFGYVTLPPLCARNGPNSFEATPGSVTLPCSGEQTAKIGEWSVQEELQERITQGLQECIRIDDYNLLGNNISIDSSAIAATVIYKVDGLVVNATLPFSVVIDGGKAIITSSSFSIDSPIRLRRMYEFLHGVLASDARIPEHNVTKDYVTDTGFTATFTIVRTDDPCLYQETGCSPEMAFDDVIALQDENVFVKGKPFELRVALKDRYPALDLIRTTSHEFADVIVSEGDRVIITPKGIDPDDKGVSYAYSGWKEDYNETFDEECWETTRAGGSASFETLKLCTDPPDPGDAPRQWSTSAPFVATKRDAWTANTTRKDAGLHLVRVNVTDLDSFRQDYQDVRVLVFDLPIANITLYHPFADIPAGFWSIEDSYLLNASASTASAVIGPIGGYNWSGGPVGSAIQFHLLSTNPMDFIPDRLPEWIASGRFYFRNTPTTLSDKDITNFPIERAGESFPVSYQLNLSVSSDDIWSYPVSEELSVYRCLPTRIGGLAYPYNISPRYNHVCCQGTPGTPSGTEWGVPYSASAHQVCFSTTDKGFLATLLEKSFIGNPGVAPTSTLTIVRTTAGTVIPTPSSSAVPFSYTNDPFNLLVSRSCDGLRGNTCTGALDLTLTQVAACKDLATGQSRRCQGPNTDFTACRNYSYGTFEGAGSCSASAHCAAGDNQAFSLTSDLPGPFLCWGACNGATGECTKAASCACALGCGAVCTLPDQFTYLNGKCTSGCKTWSTCDYASKDVTCPPVFIIPSGSSLRPIMAGFTYTTIHDPAKQEACFFQRTSVGPCTGGGCIDYAQTTLSEGRCDACTPSGLLAGDYCPAAGQIGGFCYYGSRTCGGSQGTTCQLTVKHLSEVYCDEGTEPICDAVNGIACMPVD